MNNKIRKMKLIYNSWKPNSETGGCLLSAFIDNDEVIRLRSTYKFADGSISKSSVQQVFLTGDDIAKINNFVFGGRR